MTNNNIFAAPQSEVQDLSGGQGLYSDTVVLALRRTRPWVLVLGAIGMVSTIFMLLATIGVVAQGEFFFGDNMKWPLVAIYAILTATTFIVSFQLFKFASAIKRALESLLPSDLDDVLLTQANFWRLVGILSLAMIVLSIVLTVATVVIFARAF
ncbi:MAG: hypothetical protein RLZZ422_2457 [Pseudomonadota bacterium]|jgi:hypothetical protein